MPLLRRRGRALDGVAGTVRVDRRTPNLVRRLQPGDIALIDHLDLDRVSAEALVCCGVAAVLNVQPSISGRYPNLGPEIVVGAGIPLVDALGPDLVAQLSEGDPIRLDDAGVVYRGQTALGAGTVQTRDSVAAAMEGARSGLATQLEAFAANTVEYLRRERALLLDGVGVPAIRTDLDGRHVVVVVRGYDYREDLASLRPYIREYKPVLVGVDGGADALADAGYRPDLIVGDMDSVTDRTLRCGAELVVRAYRDGTAPGQGRLERLGFTPVVFPAAGNSEDIAMLLADSAGASLIVAVGGHATLVEYLDRDRAGMASTFLTRLRVGGKLVDAKAVSRLSRGQVRGWQIALLAVVCAAAAAAAVAVAVAAAATPAGLTSSDVLGVRWDGLVRWFRNLF